ncbi:hypothetical protein JR316_0001913 [Psilocybe cubensis]|uniref:Uncharacterized protein n=2 Tax=Psilocybe cubensis TaxID=181762 RepID=A0A8H7Y2B5_PSICU|nr:hypothetical protein JR316_0001913 [Psilocybe cubensis]KAH9485009.1 hypothetical protein JR316_0001913 [Psilocybe cubensis]
MENVKSGQGGTSEPRAGQIRTGPDNDTPVEERNWGIVNRQNVAERRVRTGAQQVLYYTASLGDPTTA